MLQPIARNTCSPRSHELREGQDVPAVVFRIGDLVVRSDGPAVGRVLRRLQRARDPHLVQVGVGRERLEARMLILPPEPPDPEGAGRFADRHLDSLSGNGAVALRRLARGDCQQCRVFDGFDEPVTERVQRGAQRPDLIPSEYMLLRGGVNRPAVNEGAARVVDELAEVVDVAGAHLRDLTDASRHRILVTFAARLRVVDGAEAVRDELLLGEYIESSVECRLVQHAVGQSGETGLRVVRRRRLHRSRNNRHRPSSRHHPCCNRNK